MSEALPAVVWFRRDLRLADNPAVAAAMEGPGAVCPLYVYDEEGEGDWPEGGASKWWLHHSLSRLDKSLQALGSRLIIRRGKAEAVLMQLCQELGASEVFWNRRYEPSVTRRDTRVKKALAEAGIQGRSFNGSLLHSPLKVANQSGQPFKVFTPFWKHIQKLESRAAMPAPTTLAAPRQWPAGLEVKELNLLPKIPWDSAFYEVWEPGEAGAIAALEDFAAERVEAYALRRDTPSVEGVSKLSPYLHFGELSPWQIWHRLGREQCEPYLRQLAWREFSYHLLYHFPKTPREPLRPEFAAFPWQPDEDLLEAWRRGRTGYPLIDAGMRQLWATGWMHNRVRMVAASFLVKHLLQPWQSGAEWFWDTLVDADLANNTMGWQWVAGCGADAAPYFRVFNPIGQGERFDEQGKYTRKWVPELTDVPDKWLFRPWEAPERVLRAGTYPPPIVTHEEGRQRALDAYSAMKANA